MSVTAGITIDEYELLPDALAVNHELVDGELVDVSGNTGEHNRLRGLLERLLAIWVEDRQLTMVLAEQEYQFGANAHGPDVTFFGPNKLRLFDPKLRVQRFVPDLAIEIASPSDRHLPLMEKIRLYRECGVAEVWLLNQSARQAQVFSADRNQIRFEDDVFDPAVLPGFSVPLRRLFECL